MRVFRPLIFLKQRHSWLSLVSSSLVSSILESPEVKHNRYDDITKLIDDYLAGRTRAEQVSQYALKLLVARDFDKLDKRIRYTTYLLLDLHDEGKPWSPGADELRECRTILVDESVPLPRFLEQKLESRLTRRVRREVEKIARTQLCADEQ